MPHRLNAHFVFLVHGWLGNPTEISYVEDAIVKACSITKNDNVNIITHKMTSNHNKTTDGIEAGGKRVAKEVQDFVTNYKKAHADGSGGGDELDREFRASVSFVGYSLGGMYARYAISVLPLRFDDVRLHPASFSTAATPHLGLASHSHVALPRFLECSMGCSLGRSGRDLFRIRRGDKKKEEEDAATMPKDVVFRMATEDAFLGPLSAYRRRVSYVNAFGTDFMVPCATAGMLSSHSDSRQYASSAYDHWNDGEEMGFDILAFETKQCKKSQGPQSARTGSGIKDEALQMSLSLDNLGWSKVFVDFRKSMSGPSVRCMWRIPQKDLMNSAVADKEAVLSNSGDEAMFFESRELCDLVEKSEYFHLAPAGHFLLVAHSKTKRGARKYAKGRPFVDQAALDLVNFLKDFRATLDGETIDDATEQINRSQMNDPAKVTGGA